MVSGKTLAIAATATAAVAGLGYIAYFDYKRRTDRKFRRKLNRDRKKVEKTAQKITSRSLDDINDQAMELLNIVTKEKLPESPEQKEQFFMAQVSQGETLCAAGEAGYAEAACRFYQALKVYPNPVELVMIYQKTTPDEVFKLVMAMMAQEVRQKQARYFDVFPPREKNVEIKDKNKVEKKEGAKSDIVVPDRGLFSTKDFTAGEIIYEEESVVSTLLPCAMNGQFCYNCMKNIPNKKAEEEEVTAEKTANDETKETTETEATEDDQSEGSSESATFSEAVKAGLTPESSNKSTAAFECDKCHEAFYCSEECRTDAYDAYHQFLCPGSSSSSTARDFAVLTQKAHELAPVLIAKFFGVLVDREKKKELARMLGTAGPTSEVDEYTTWEHLECMRYLELIPSASDATMLRKLSELMSRGVPGLSEFVTGERYTMLKGKLDYNTYAVHNSAEGIEVPADTPETHVSDTMRNNGFSGAVGLALYLISSHITHNCDPNVQIVFPNNTNKAAIKTLKPIAKGEELHVSFVDASLEKGVRQKRLNGSYRIICTCDKCKAENSAAEAKAAEDPVETEMEAEFDAAVEAEADKETEAGNEVEAAVEAEVKTEEEARFEAAVETEKESEVEAEKEAEATIESQNEVVAEKEGAVEVETKTKPEATVEDVPETTVEDVPEAVVKDVPETFEETVEDVLETPAVEETPVEETASEETPVEETASEETPAAEETVLDEIIVDGDKE
ncbi:mitochondrial import receptor subunit tom20 [Kickxella alabastrina]|nr:mitochondrial import receptor subunit tom20 [Kickxella alabastrina]